MSWKLTASPIRVKVRRLASIVANLPAPTAAALAAPAVATICVLWAATATAACCAAAPMPRKCCASRRATNAAAACPASISNPAMVLRLSPNALMATAAAVLAPVALSVSATYSAHCVDRFCRARPTVGGNLANSAATVSLWPLIAPITVSLLSSPASAILRSSPVVTPKPSASARARRGLCSITLLNSSPLKTPPCSPCTSCVMAALDASAPAPLS